MGNNKIKSGFTLIELSIVLVIIGLIIGGVLVGKDLVIASEIRAQLSQLEKYQVAAKTFRIKYGSLPGDIKNSDAVAFGFTARGTVAGQGNGDGLVEGTISGGTNWGPFIGAGETAIFWRDLSDAKLIDAAFSAATIDYATDCAAPMSVAAIKSRYPQAKIGNNNYVYVWNGGWAAPIISTQNDHNNYFGLSQITDPCFNAGQGAFDVSITPNQAYAMDKKIDDGLPQSGTVMATYPNVGEDWHALSISTFAAGGDSDPAQGQKNAGAVNLATFGGPVGPGTTPAIAVDPQADYNSTPQIIDCYDNRNVSNAIMEYTTQFMGGNNRSCALSFRFQ